MQRVRKARAAAAVIRDRRGLSDGGIPASQVGRVVIENTVLVPGCKSGPSGPRKVSDFPLSESEGALRLREGRTALPFHSFTLRIRNSIQY